VGVPPDSGGLPLREAALKTTLREILTDKEFIKDVLRVYLEASVDVMMDMEDT